MGIKIANLIDCTLCCHYDKDTESCKASTELNTALLVNGKGYATKCKSFRNIREPVSNEMELENVLEYMLAGYSEFTMLSVKTGKKLRYRLDRKQHASNDGEFIYWLNTEGENGLLIYAGVLYFDYNDKQFKFGRGARGSLDAKDQRVNSLLFVVNKLYNKQYNMQLKVYNTGKCGVCNSRLNADLEIQTGICDICRGQYRKHNILEPVITPNEEDINGLFEHKPIESDIDNTPEDDTHEEKWEEIEASEDDPWFNSDSNIWW